MTSRPVLVVFSVLAGLQVMAGGAALTDVVGVKPAGLFVLGVAAAQVGMTFYVQRSVTPLADPRDADGNQLRALASGGPVRSGTPYLVGEQRADLFVGDTTDPGRYHNPSTDLPYPGPTENGGDGS